MRQLPHQPRHECHAVSQLDALFAPFRRSDAPGLVIGVARQGRVIYRRGFGMASLEHGTANTPTTRMRIGSTTKHFTCIGILLLEAEGMLRVDCPIRDYLPELDNVCGEPTLLQLMQHTGGLPDTSFATFLANGGYHGHTPAGGTLQILRRLRRLNFAPGTRMAYNNDGYALLSWAIERISGQSWNDFMTERLFAPLGMANTALLRSDLDIVPGMATLHLPSGDGWRRGLFFSDDLLGAGGLISSVDDMLRWAAHLRGVGSDLLGAGLRERLHERPRFVGGASPIYGLGLMKQRYRGVEIVHHAGAVMGAQSQMLLAPAQALDIVIMSNRMDAAAPALALQALEAVLGEPILDAEPEPPDATDYRALHGHWFSSASRTLLSIGARSLKAGQHPALTLAVHNAPAGALHRSAAGLARDDGPHSPLELRSLPATSDPPPCLEVHVCGEPERFERLPAEPPAVAQVALGICGRYRAPDLAKDVEIRLHEGRLLLDLLPPSGRAQWELEIYTDDVLGCGRFHSTPDFPLPLLATLTMDRQEDEVRGFWLNADRMRNVRFDRCGPS